MNVRILLYKSKTSDGYTVKSKGDKKYLKKKNEYFLG